MRGYLVCVLVVLILGGLVYSCVGHFDSQQNVFGTVEEVRLAVVGQQSAGSSNTGDVITGALAGGAIAETVGGSRLVLPGAAVGAAIAGSDTVRGEISAAQMIVSINSVRVLFTTTEEEYTVLFGLLRAGDPILLQYREMRESGNLFNFAMTSATYGWQMNEFGNGGVEGIVLPSKLEQK